ncbi:MAG: hypothetical protein MJ125_06585 [Clostridia bacterium]|nr:hypothetical protein [Clostridia bacterium]
MKKTLPIIMATVMVASLLVFFAVKSKKTNKDYEISAPIGEKVEFLLENSIYTKKLTVAGENGEIFLPTDKEGLYYTATLENEIKFWNYASGKFTPASYETKKTTVSVNSSGVSVPVTLTFIDADGLTVGYGVFTSNMNASVEVYSYAFCKIAKNPAGYGDGYMLLCDFNKESFWKADKIYSEIFTNFVPGSTSSVSCGLNQNTRLVDKNGGLKQSWSMMTDEFMKNTGGEKLFLSSRYYTAEEYAERADVMVYSSAYRPSIIAKDIIDCWFVSDDEGFHYMIKDGENFKSVTVKDGAVYDAVKFDSPRSSYLRSGNYVVNKDTNVMTNLMTGDKVTLKDISIRSASRFSVNADGTNMVFASDTDDIGNGTPSQAITYYSTESGKGESFVEPLIRSEESDFVWVDGNSVMSVRALTNEGTPCGSVIYTFGN